VSEKVEEGKGTSLRISIWWIRKLYVEAKPRTFFNIIDSEILSTMLGGRQEMTRRGRPL
jgi:hypothetical protein